MRKLFRGRWLAVKFSSQREDGNWPYTPGPEREANWLPAPDGPFALALRIYWPGQEILDVKWEPSAIKKA